MDLCNFAPGAGKVVPRFKPLTCMVSKLMYVLCSIEHCDLKHTFRIFVVVYNNPSFKSWKIIFWKLSIVGSVFGAEIFWEIKWYRETENCQKSQIGPSTPHVAIAVNLQQPSFWDSRQETIVFKFNRHLYIDKNKKSSPNLSSTGLKGSPPNL